MHVTCAQHENAIMHILCIISPACKLYCHSNSTSAWHALAHFLYLMCMFVGVSPTMPVIRDHCGYIYAREWSGGVLAGMFEPKAKPCFKNGIPKPFEFQLFSEDWDHFRKPHISLHCAVYIIINGCQWRCNLYNNEISS